MTRTNPRTTTNTDTDILISIYPKHVADIVAQVKVHEFRKYKIPTTVQRMWIYETAPVSSVRYCATIEPGKLCGELAQDDLDGLTDQHFNHGELSEPGGPGVQYAYKISELYRLERSFSLEDLKGKGWLKGAPQKYNFASQEMVSELRPVLEKLF